MIDAAESTRAEESACPARERRRGCRSDPLISLAAWLEAARTRARLEALALADETGLLVAGAGCWQTCEYLAAVAAWTDTSPDSFRGHIELRLMTARGLKVLLCCRGPEPGRAQALDLAARGCMRILGLS